MAIQNDLEPTWGAFMCYLGVDVAKFKQKFPHAAGHHQVVVDHTKPLGEGNSVFFSMTDFSERDRAPEGAIPVTMSTHTETGQWWRLHGRDKAAYAAQKELYLERMLTALERALPGIRETIVFQTNRSLWRSITLREIGHRKEYRIPFTQRFGVIDHHLMMSGRMWKFLLKFSHIDAQIAHKRPPCRLQIILNRHR